MQAILVCLRDSTSAAIMCRAAKQAGIHGRLVPVPRSVQASCGLAWASCIEHEAAVRALAGDVPHGVVAVLDWDGTL